MSGELRGSEGGTETRRLADKLLYIYEEIGPLWVQSSSVSEISHNPLLQSYWMCFKHPTQGNADLQ